VPALYTRNPLFAFFSLFAARFSIRLLAGFFFASFFVSIALLIAGSLDWREQLPFCTKAAALRPMQSSATVCRGRKLFAKCQIRPTACLISAGELMNFSAFLLRRRRE
jgi:hypothetical protein